MPLGGDLDVEVRMPRPLVGPAPGRSLGRGPSIGGKGDRFDVHTLEISFLHEEGDT